MFVYKPVTFIETRPLVSFFCNGFVLNYRMNIRKLSNEYCSTLSNGFVLNYPMIISKLSNGYFSKLSNE